MMRLNLLRQSPVGTVLCPDTFFLTRLDFSPAILVIRWDGVGCGDLLLRVHGAAGQEADQDQDQEDALEAVPRHLGNPDLLSP